MTYSLAKDIAEIHEDYNEGEMADEEVCEELSKLLRKYPDIMDRDASLMLADLLEDIGINVGA